MSLMAQLNLFIEEDNFKNLLNINGYKIIKDNNNKLKLYNENTKKYEDITIIIKDSSTITLKGNSISFKATRDNKGKLYLKKLLKKDNKTTFIMNFNLDKDNNKVINIKLLDTKNNIHIYCIDENNLNIKLLTKTYTINYNFNKSDNGIELTSSNKKLSNSLLKSQCTKEFCILELSNISITKYLSNLLPITETCINMCYQQEMKIYDIKRSYKKDKSKVYIK